MAEKTPTNERGAGRNKKFTVPTKKIIIPTCIEDEVKEISKPYLTIKTK